MAFTNTVETVGDAALTRSIIDRSITELNDNISVSIRQQAFRACSALASVNFPNVTNVALGAFWQCTALEKADFASCVTFANNAFYGCTALSALILRCTDQLCTITGTPFAGSAIANGTGYIYVPAVLLSTYKSDSAWSTYAAQIRAIEDYPEVCDPYSWVAVFKAIDAGTYKDVYKVGDLVPLDLGTEGVVNMQIAAFDADDLADGSGKAPISWISKELLATSHRMNPSRVTNSDGIYQEGTGGIGGWGMSEMRTYMQETIKPLIPEEVRSRLLTVTKTQPSYTTTGGSETQTTEDDVWLPSYTEVFSSSGLYYSLFHASANRIKKKSWASSASSWWLRSAYNITSFNYVDTSGGSNFYGASDSYRVALGFCT